MGRAPSAGGPRGFAARYLLDPTVHFVGGCLLTPPVFAALEPGGSSRALGYFSDPFLLGSLFLTGAAAWVTARSPDWYAPPPLPPRPPDPPTLPSLHACPPRPPPLSPPRRRGLSGDGRSGRALSGSRSRCETTGRRCGTS